MDAAPSSKRLFVLTLVFSPDLSDVVLLNKLRGPDGVRGRINYPGGGIERGENALVAGSREDEEELGLIIPVSAWSVVDFQDFGDAELTTLACVCDTWHQAQSCTDEQVFVAGVDGVRIAALAEPERYAQGFVHLLDAGLKVMRALGHGAEAAPVSRPGLRPR